MAPSPSFAADGQLESTSQGSKHFPSLITPITPICQLPGKSLGSTADESSWPLLVPGPIIKTGGCPFRTAPRSYNRVPSKLVSRVLFLAAIYLGRQSPGASSDQTRGVGGQPHPPPTWSCSGWGLPSEPVSRPLVRSYRTVAPLPGTQL